MSTKNNDTMHTLKNIFERKKRRRNSENDEDEDDMFEAMIGVYSEGNKIYFNSSVSVSSVNQLCRLIEKRNKEYSHLENSGYFKSTKPLPLWLFIESGGGDVFAGNRAINAIQTSKIPIYTVIMGIAGSMGSQMAVAGEKTFMTSNSYMLIHQVRISGITGKYQDIEDEYGNLSNIHKSSINLYLNNSRITKKRLIELIKREKLLDFKTCYEYGLIDGEWTGDNTLANLKENDDDNDDNITEKEEINLREALTTALLKGLTKEDTQKDEETQFKPRRSKRHCKN